MDEQNVVHAMEYYSAFKKNGKCNIKNFEDTEATSHKKTNIARFLSYEIPRIIKCRETEYNSSCQGGEEGRTRS